LGTSPSPVPYAQQAERHALALDDERRRSSHLSTARLTFFLIGAASLIWALSRDVTSATLILPAIAFVVFGILVVRHARIEERIAWHDANRLVNVRALARIAREWQVLPDADPPPGLDVSSHPYALDLDLFGRASLLQVLGPAATPRGKLTLVSWLLTPAARLEIVERQGAIAALAELDAWRVDLAAHGILVARAREEEIAAFIEWAEGPETFGRYSTLLRRVVIAIAVPLWGLIAASALGLLPPLWSIPLVIGIVLSYGCAYSIGKTLDRAGAGQDAFGRYAAIFKHAVKVPPAGQRLVDLVARLSAGGVHAPECMRQLNRILGFGQLRHGAATLHFPIQAVTLWDFWVVFALDRWRRRCGHRVRSWFDALGELDALALFATVQRDNPDWAVPEIQDEPKIEAEAIGHLLLPDDRRVDNDITIGPRGSVVLITGSNMSGKSTLLRAIGLNLVLAQAGACVCARRMVLPESDLETSLRVQDSLERGLSYFMAALARLKGVVDAAEHERSGRVLVYLLDEILQGTNSAERSIAVRAVARHLLDAGAIGAMTTHDLSIAGEEPLKTAARCLHFSETLDENGLMHFDYKLKPGLATSRNALRLMQMIGIDV
jgi:hypothetical protein